MSKDYTLNRLINDKSEHIFVLNMTPSFKKIGYNVSFDINYAGTMRSILIHSTWIPQDISEQAPKQIILDSPNFRRCFSQGQIKLMNPEEALAILAKPEAQEEKHRLMLKMQRVNDQIPEDQRLPPLPAELEKEDVPSNINPLVVDMCMRDDLTPIDVYSKIKTIEAGLTKEDITHLIRNLPDKARDERIENFLSERKAA